MDRSHPLFNENLFRPTFEVKAGNGLAGLGVSNLLLASTSHQPTLVALAVSATLFTMASANYIRSLDRVKLHAAMKYNDFTYAQLDDLILSQLKDDEKCFMGVGFPWGPEHTRRVREIMRLSSDMSEVKLPFLYNLLTKDKSKNTKKLGGHPYIHAVGHKKANDEIEVITENLKSHSMLFGQVGSGKTTMLQLLSTMALVRKNTIIIIDPKNDGNWRRSLKYTAKAMGKPFYYFHPSKPTGDVVRIDAIGTYNKASEIASRLKGILPGGGDSEAFANYAWSQFNTVAEGILFTGLKPNLITMHRYLFSDRHALVEKVIERYMEMFYGYDWREEKTNDIKRAGGENWIEQLTNHFKNVLLIKEAKDEMDNRHRRTVTSMINYITSEDPSRYAMMMSTTKPLIEQLVATPLDELLSPKFVPGGDDHRPIITTKGVMETGGVLYIALDAMSDSTIAGVTAKMLLADICANAAERYNNEDEDGQRLSLFIDEAHSALNDPLVDLMAMGRQAGIEVYLSSQTLPDYEHKAGKEIAKRLTGLCGNMITLRVSDKDTQEFCTSRLGGTRVRDVERSVSSGSSTETSIKDYSSGYSEKYKDTDADVFPITLLSDLPKLQYMAHYADGSKQKGIIPILKFDSKTSKLLKTG